MKYSVGDILTNNDGDKYCIIQFTPGRKGITRYVIEFEGTGHVQYAFPSSISKGNVPDQSKPFVCGVGYIAERGKLVEIDANIYRTWYAMLYRCYGDKVKRPYMEVTVCDEWHNYSNFADWYKDNYPISENAGSYICLDKDLLGDPNNKVYSPHSCCFLPTAINAFVVNLDVDKGVISEDTPPRKVFDLAEMLDKYKPILSIRVYSLLNAYIKNYIDKFNAENRMSFLKTFGSALNKTDISQVRITAFIEYKGALSKFTTIGELKGFINKLEKRALVYGAEKL